MLVFFVLDYANLENKKQFESKFKFYKKYNIEIEKKTTYRSKFKKLKYIYKLRYFLTC